MLRTAAVAAALAAAGPLAAQPPAPSSPPAGAATRPYLLKTLVPPPTSPGLPPDVDVAFADAHVRIALSDPTPANKDALLDAARTRYQRALRQNPAHKGALLGLVRMSVGLDDRERAAAGRLATDPPKPAPAVTPVAPNVVVSEAFVLRSDAAVEATPPTAPAPRELAELTAAYRLRHAAAADVARALKEHLGGACEIDAREDALVVRGSVATHARVAALVADLDREPVTFHLSVTILQVGAGFLTECGLQRPGGTDLLWTLTERETALFSAALRHHPNLTVLSRPQVRVADGQTGHVQVGQDVPVRVEAAPGPVRQVEFVPTGVSARLTPRRSADGTATLLRIDGEVSGPAAPARAEQGAAFRLNTATVQTSVVVPAGHAAVLAVPTTGADGKPAAVLYVVAPAVWQP